MNPDQNRNGMTVNTLMQTASIASAVIPVVTIALLGFAVTLNLNSGTLILVIIGCAILVLLAVILVNYFAQRKIKDRLLGLVDICRDYAGGDRAARSIVNGDDEFAMLSMSLNTLLDNQGSMPGIS